MEDFKVNVLDAVMAHRKEVTGLFSEIKDKLPKDLFVYTDNELCIMSDYVQVKHYQKDHVIVKKDEEAKVAIVISGSLCVNKNDKEFLYESGEYCGEMSIIKWIEENPNPKDGDVCPMLNTIKVKEDAILLEMTSKDFQSWFVKYELFKQ